MYDACTGARSAPGGLTGRAAAVRRWAAAGKRGRLARRQARPGEAPVAAWPAPGGVNGAGGGAPALGSRGRGAVGSLAGTRGPVKPPWRRGVTHFLASAGSRAQTAGVRAGAELAGGGNFIVSDATEGASRVRVRLWIQPGRRQGITAILADRPRRGVGLPPIRAAAGRAARADALGAGAEESPDGGARRATRDAPFAKVRAPGRGAKAR